MRSACCRCFELFQALEGLTQAKRSETKINKTSIGTSRTQTMENGWLMSIQNDDVAATIALLSCSNSNGNVIFLVVKLSWPFDTEHYNNFYFSMSRRKSSMPPPRVRSDEINK